MILDALSALAVAKGSGDSSGVVLVAVITTTGTAVVALAGAVGAIYGPVWRESRARAAETKRAQRDVRFTRAEELLREVTRWASGGGGVSATSVEMYRVAFVAALEAGEGAVARYVGDEIGRITRQRNQSNGTSTVGARQFSDDLFAYLRGDLQAVDLRYRHDANRPDEDD